MTNEARERGVGKLVALVALCCLIGAVVITTVGTAVAAQSTSGNASVTPLDDCRELNESGVYQVTQNITAPADENCFHVTADNVTLDGGGHFVVGNGSGGPSGHPVSVRISDAPTGFTRGTAENVTIRHIGFANWYQGVSVRKFENVTVTDMTFVNTSYLGGTAGEDGISVFRGSNLTIQDSHFEETAGPGISVTDVTGLQILNSTVLSPNSHGMIVHESPNATIRGNFVTGAHGGWGGMHGIVVRGYTRGVSVVSNNVTGNHKSGISVGNTRNASIRNNTVLDNGNQGIKLSGGHSENSTIADNLVVGNGRNGLRVKEPSNVTIAENSIKRNDGKGVFLWNAKHALVRDNVAENNGGNGIHVNDASDVTVRSNVAVNHTTGGFRDGHGIQVRRGSKRALVVENVVRGNRIGIGIKGGPGSSTTTRNRIVNNTEAGVKYGFNMDLAFHDLHQNVIEGNGNYGVHNRGDDSDVDATDNWWGSADGPGTKGSPPIEDPATGTLADGSGDNVTENDTEAGISNVEFDPWLETKPTLGIGDLGIVTDELPPTKVDRRVRDQIVARGGTPPIDDYEIVDGTLPPGTTLRDDGVLNGTATTVGNYTFTVRVTDSENETANRTFTKRVVATVPRPQIDIEKAGTGATPGRKTLYLIRVENTGSTVARNVPVNEFLEPWWTYTDATPVPGNVSSTVIRNGTADYVESLVETNETDLNFTGDVTQTTLSWTIDELRPGESRLLTYQVRLDSRIPDGFTVRGEACACQGGCCENFNRCKEEVVAGCTLPGDLGRGSTVFDCITLDTAGCAYGLFGPDPEELCNRAGEKAICQRDYEACRAYNGLDPEQPPAPPCDEDEQNASTPTDPNEKVVGAERYIRPNRTLPYVIHFENVGNATATNVTVTDRIPDELNLSSVRVFTANRTRVDVNATTPATLLQRNITRRRNATIGNETVTRNETVVEEHTAILDDRTLRWHLENTDLPPNGTGTLLMEATPTQGLADGTRIENNATIRFDEVSSLTTNNTVNIIDTAAPSCTVDSLPERSPRDIELSWSGSDPVGEIEDVTIYVSTDGESWEIAEVDLEDESVTYEGEFGETYRFMCLAEDTAGNTESQTPQAEATTSVTAVDVSGSIQEADGEPAANDTVAIGDGDAATAPVVINDWNGTTCQLLQLDRAIPTDAEGQFSYRTDVGGTESLSYYQSPIEAFPQGNGTLATDEVAFPRDGSPDLYGLDRFTADGDVALGNVSLPTAHPLNVSVVTADGSPVENATIRVTHTGTNGTAASVVFPRATTASGLLVPDRSDAAGVEVTGNVTVAVRVPNESRLEQRLYTRNLTVDAARNLTVEVNVTEPIDDEPPVIERFEHSRAPEPVSEARPTTVSLALSDASPGTATVQISPADGDGVVFERDVSGAFGETVSFEWNGTNGTGEPIAHGPYDLVLTATDATGQTNSSSIRAVVSAVGGADSGNENDEKRDDKSEEKERGNGADRGNAGGNSASRSGGLTLDLNRGRGRDTGNAIFEIDASVDSERVELGESVRVEATVRNTGGSAGEITVALLMDGEPTGENQTVELDAGARTTITLEHAPDSIGMYAVAVNETAAGTVTVLPAGAESMQEARVNGTTASFGDGVVEQLDFANAISGDVRVTRRSSLAADLPVPDGTLLVPFEVDAPAGGANQTATITFGLSQSELDAATVDAATVRLLHYDEDTGTWDELETAVRDRTDERVTFAAETALSTFAVVGQSSGEATTEEPDESTTLAPVTTANTPAADISDTATTDADGPGFGVASAMLAVLALVSVARLARRD